MDNRAKVVGVASGIIVLYESLKYGIDHCVESYLPEPLAKYFPTKLIAGGAALALGAVVSSYAIVRMDIGDLVNNQVQAVGELINKIGMEGGVEAINKLKLD